MANLELNIVGDIPAGLDVGPLKQMIAVLNETAGDWLVSGVISLKLVDDKAIQALNKTYGGNDYATDVLSFSYIENKDMQEVKTPVEPLELGDMVISLETAQRQAESAGITLDQELATLALHGALHIYGFDHAEASERSSMEDIQTKVLSQANITYRDFKWK